MIAFPSIVQYKNVIRSINERHAYVGKDENGDAIYKQNSEPLPVLKYTGTCKLHGTNSSIVQDKDGNITFQSRNRQISKTDDNAGFATYFSSLNDNVLQDLFKECRTLFNLNNTVAVYGEWCGGNIQKGVALTQIKQKMFVIFAIADIVDGEIVSWVSVDNMKNINFHKYNDNIYSAYEFKHYEITIDFNNPKLVQNDLIQLTLDVEKKCPVGQAFNVDGVGEGIVWRPNDPNFQESKFWFKVKGEEHSVSKVKTLVEVDLEKMNSVTEFVNAVLTGTRLNQGLDYLKEMNLPLTQKSTGDYLSWVIKDVQKEEFDRATESGLDWKEVSKQLGTRARKYFFEHV